MSVARATRAGRFVTAAALGATALLGPGVLAAPAAGAPSPSTGPTPVTVAVDQLTPALPQPGDTLIVTGRLTNTGPTDVRTVGVRLTLASDAVGSRAELERISSGSEVPSGDPVWESQTDLTPSLAAGASIDFTISLPVGSLGLSSPAIRVITVEALGDLVVGDGRGAEPVGSTTTFLPWFPRTAADDVSATGVVWLWPLTARPAVDGAGVHLDDTLGRSLAPGGRLRRLLDLALGAPVPLTYLVDPALLETVAAMTGGYRVRGQGGVTVPGTHAADADRWLTDLRALLDRPAPGRAVPPTVLALPYALPDVVALHRAGLDLAATRTITEASARVRAVLGRAVTGVLPWPPGGRTDASTLDLMLAAGTEGVLLSSAAMPLEPRSARTADGVADLPGADQVAVLADARLSRALAMPTDEPTEALLARQRLIAELEAITLEDPGQARTVVASPEPLWDPDPATVTAWWSVTADSPFATASTYEELLALPAAGPSGPSRSIAGYPRRERRAELAPPYLARVGRVSAALAGFRSVTSSAGGDGSDAADLALGRAVSSLWREETGQARELLDSVQSQVEALIDQVRIVSQGSTTFPGESGVVPVVIANDLDQPARVGIALSATPAVRFDADPYPPLTIAAHTKASVEVPARVVGSGDVVVAVQLVTADGAPYGSAVEITVRSTAYGRVAGIAAGAAFALLVVMLVINFRRRRRRPGPAGASPESSDGPSHDPPAGAAVSAGHR